MNCVGHDKVLFYERYILFTNLLPYLTACTKTVRSAVMMTVLRK